MTGARRQTHQDGTIGVRGARCRLVRGRESARHGLARRMLSGDTDATRCPCVAEFDQRRKNVSLDDDLERPRREHVVKDVLEGVTSDKTKGLLPRGRDPNKRLRNVVAEDGSEYITAKSGHNLHRVIDELEKEMREAAANLEFEEAARLRDEVKKLRDTEIGLGIEPLPPEDSALH